MLELPPAPPLHNMFSFPSYPNPFAPEELQGKIGYKICSSVDEKKKKNQLADQSSEKRGRVKYSGWMVAVVDLNQRTAYSCLVMLGTISQLPGKCTHFLMLKKFSTSELLTHTKR